MRVRRAVMKILFVAKQKKNVDTFDTTIDALVARGHQVVLAIQERDAARDERLAARFPAAGFSLVPCPDARGDAWQQAAPLLRSTRDWVQYGRPAYAAAGKLRRRAFSRLLKALGGLDDVDAAGPSLTPDAAARAEAALARVEASVPSDPLHEEFLRRHAPDVVLVTPGLHFGSGQADFIKSARALGLPVWMLLFSWDNLSTKGALHVAPDRLFVWNARQVREAVELHGYDEHRVIVVGAPRFDAFFALQSVVEKDAFLAPLRLHPSGRTLLYLCSSRFIAADELAFIRTWLAAVRASRTDALRTANVIVRPHPDVALPLGDPETVTWRQMPQASGWVHRPFDDPGAVVLRTTYGTPQAFFECLHHADAVVGLNTSAELEAGIAGRPVLTVLATGDAADGQSHTLHFEYLLREHGGFVRYSRDLDAHLQDLADALVSPPAPDEIRAFVRAFLRPHGDRPVAPLLADALVAEWEPTSREARAAAAPARPASAPEIELGPDDAPTDRTIAVGEPASGVSVLATPHTRARRRKGVLALDPGLVAWMHEQVGPGDVVYDVGAGVGAYALLAARARRALVVAFEPGYGVFRALCDNVRLNACGRSVVPLPVALGDRTGLLELEYAGEDGSDAHVLRARDWRPKTEAPDARTVQPVCAERLDDVRARHRLPAPHAIRIAVRRNADAVLRGAAATLASPSLRTLVVALKERDEVPAIVQAVHGSGLGAPEVTGSEGFGVLVRFGRTAAEPAAGRVQQVATRLRRLW